MWASDLPPLAELTDGITAALPHQPAAWAAAARRIPAEGARLGQAGRARLLERYGAHRMRAAYELLYDELEMRRGRRVAG